MEELDGLDFDDIEFGSREPASPHPGIMLTPASVGSLPRMDLTPQSHPSNASISHEFSLKEHPIPEHNESSIFKDLDTYTRH